MGYQELYPIIHWYIYLHFLNFLKIIDLLLIISLPISQNFEAKIHYLINYLSFLNIQNKINK